jgi:Flp pilus assembly protein TadG
MKMSKVNARPGERGNAMIEFALSSLVLITMFIFTFQFGYTFYVYSKLQTAIRNGGRYASVRTLRAGSGTSITKYKTAVQQMVVYGSPTATAGATVVPGLTPAGITVNVTNAAGTAASSSVQPYKVQVYVSSYSLDALFRTYSFSSKPYENFPYVGVWQPTDTE